jgi:uncharacterized protein (DUF58 family)
MCSGSAINERVPRYGISLAVSAAVATGVLSGLFLFVSWAGWAGAAGILSVAGVLLAWFYRGRRPDREAGQARRDRFH